MMILAKRITEEQKKEILENFIQNKTIEEISENFNFTKLTITRHLKKSLGEKQYSEIIKKTKKTKKTKENDQTINLLELQLNNQKGSEVEVLDKESSPENSFFEIMPLDYQIDNLPQKDLSSVSISEVNLPKVVYMVVNKQIELETKSLKNYAEWSFLSEEDLSRNTIEIFYDIKYAKRSCKKDQKVIKVPNSNVFRITASILKARGISRIVSSESLIAL